MRLDLDLAGARLADRFTRGVVATVLLVGFGVTGARAEEVEPTHVVVAKPAESIGMCTRGRSGVAAARAGAARDRPVQRRVLRQIDSNPRRQPRCAPGAHRSRSISTRLQRARKIDVFLELRIGLESDFGSTATAMDAARVFHLSPGGRFFFGDSGTLKLFTTAQLVIDASGYKDVTGTGLGTDFGLRNMGRATSRVGTAVGETATFARWLRFEL
jgi:hypothetical protein